MNRILVIGCCGAGKSTLSRKLHGILGIELVHLDQHYWKPNWIEPDEEDWINTVDNLLDKNQWIMDGNYGGTLDRRIKKADTIIYLDYPTSKCLSRVVKRVLQNNGKVRLDMADGCKERFNLEFLHYVATFKHTRGNKILSKLKQLERTKRVLIFKNDTEVDSFCATLKVQAANTSNILPIFSA